MIRSLVLFVHVVGVLALFVGLGLEWLSLDAVQRASVRAEALRWVRVSVAVPRVTGMATAIIVASGFYLGSRVAVLGDGWMLGSYAALLIMGIIAGPVTRSRMRVLQRLASDSSDGGVTTLQSAASDALLRVSLRVRVAFGLAVVYLMIGKPDAGECLVVLSLACILAIVMTVPKRPASSTLVEGYR